MRVCKCQRKLTVAQILEGWQALRTEKKVACLPTDLALSYWDSPCTGEDFAYLEKQNNCDNLYDKI